MKPNFYQIFRYKLIEAAEEPEATNIENESNLEKVLKTSPKLTSVLVKLLTTQGSKNDKALNQIREVIADLKCISYKPTTFRALMANGNFFDIKYDPTPLELKYPEDFSPSDAFQVIVSGKKYNIANKSEYEQALDYINTLLKTKNVSKEPEPDEQPAQASPEGGEEAGGAPPPPPEGEETPPEETA